MNPNRADQPRAGGAAQEGPGDPDRRRPRTPRSCRRRPGSRSPASPTPSSTLSPTDHRPQERLGAARLAEPAPLRGGDRPRERGPTHDLRLPRPRTAARAPDAAARPTGGGRSRLRSAASASPGRDHRDGAAVLASVDHLRARRAEREQPGRRGARRDRDPGGHRPARTTSSGSTARSWSSTRRLGRLRAPRRPRAVLVHHRPGDRQHPHRAAGRPLHRGARAGARHPDRRQRRDRRRAQQRRASSTGRVTLVCSVLGTLPPFVIGMALIVVFAVKLQLLPAGGYVPLGRRTRPSGCASRSCPASRSASTWRPRSPASCAPRWSARCGRTTSIGAQMRGFGRRRVLFGHVLRNAAGPTLAVIGLAIPLIMGGAVITEKLFGLPGIAQLALQSAEKGDVPVVLGTLLVTAVIVVAASLVVNVAPGRARPGRPPRRRRRRGSAMTTLRALLAHPEPARVALRRSCRDRVPGGASAARSRRTTRSRQYTDEVLQGPTAEHLLGTDYVGRDVLQPADGRHPALGGRCRWRRSRSAAVLGVPSGLAVGVDRAGSASGSRCGSRHADDPAVHRLRHRGGRHPRQRAAAGDGRGRRPDQPDLLPGHPGGGPRPVAGRSTSRPPS